MLEVRQLHKSYQGRQVLAPLSFVLPPGQCLGLAGSNGSGKSTLLRLIAQIERADGGDVLYQGHSILGDRLFLRSACGIPSVSSISSGAVAARSHARTHLITSTGMAWNICPTLERLK